GPPRRRPDSRGCWCGEGADCCPSCDPWQAPLWKREDRVGRSGRIKSDLRLYQTGVPVARLVGPPAPLSFTEIAVSGIIGCRGTLTCGEGEVWGGFRRGGGSAGAGPPRAQRA